MTTKSKQLVRAGHELASELKADCGAVDVRGVANLLTELASALDVQSARSDALEAALKASEANDADARCHVAELEAKCSELAVENSGMDAFVAAMLSIAWQGGNADGADIQNLALENGLLRQEVYSADAHENLVGDAGNFEEGDPVYFRVENPNTDAWVNEQRAVGVDGAINVILTMMDRIAPAHHAISMLRAHAAQLRGSQV